MPDMREAFGGGEYLRASDISKPTPVIISNLGREQVRGDNGPEDKWVVSFAGAKRRLVLNVTNNNKLCDSFGYESDDWIGKRVILTVVDLPFSGRTVKGIRLEVPAQPQEQVAVTPQFPPATPEPPVHQPVADADIPF